MHSLGTRLGSWGRTVGKPQAANPLVTESKGEGSINDPFKGEKCKFFFNSLSPFWKPPEHRYRLVYDAHWPLGQLDFWICQPFCKRVEMMKNIWCNESTPKLKKKNPNWLYKSEIVHCDFPLAHTVNFLHHWCKNKLCKTYSCCYSGSNELTNTFSVLLEGLQMLYSSHSLQKLLRSALQNIKKKNWIQLQSRRVIGFHTKKKNPQPKAVHLSLEDKKSPEFGFDCPPSEVITVILINGQIYKFSPTDSATMLY